MVSNSRKTHNRVKKIMKSEEIQTLILKWFEDEKKRLEILADKPKKEKKLSRKQAGRLNY